MVMLNNAFFVFCIVPIFVDALLIGLIVWLKVQNKCCSVVSVSSKKGNYHDCPVNSWGTNDAGRKECCPFV